MEKKKRASSTRLPKNAAKVKTAAEETWTAPKGEGSYGAQGKTQQNSLGGARRWRPTATHMPEEKGETGAVSEQKGASNDTKKNAPRWKEKKALSLGAWEEPHPKKKGGICRHEKKKKGIIIMGSQAAF